MSQQNSIKLLLEIQDENIQFENEVSKVVRKNIIYKQLKTRVTADDICECPHCKSKNFVKNGWKKSIVRYLNFQNNPLELVLNKQRLLCKDCKKSFMPEVSFVKKNSQISNLVKKSILFELRENLSLKYIAKKHNVSVTTVQRVFDKGYKNYVPNHSNLPEILCFDEFKSTKDIKGAMSFIFLDWKTKKIIDIVEDRKLESLIDYFSNFSYKARANVKYVVMDMYKPYMVLTKKMFPNAKIILDFFHMVQSISKGFNSARIHTMNLYKTKDPILYGRLKREWRNLLMDSFKLSEKRCYCPSFRQFISPAEKVRYLVRKTDELYHSYTAYQELLYAIQTRNFNAFMDLIDEFRNKVSPSLKKSFRTFKHYREYIESSLAHNFSNGPIEGMNNLIKAIKRTAYGYRCFSNFRKRILVIRGDILISSNF